MKNTHVVSFVLASTLSIATWVGISASTSKETPTGTIMVNTAYAPPATDNAPTIEKRSNFDLSEKGRKTIQQKLTIPIRRIVFGTKKTKVKEFMSRCPSGVHDNIQKNPLTAGQFYYGEVVNYDNCYEKLICEFRLSSDEKTLQVWDNTNKVFTSPEKWLPAQTTAKLERQNKRELEHLYQDATEQEQSAEGKH